MTLAAHEFDPRACDSGPKPNVNPAYIGLRKDLLALIAQSPRSVLDLGCAQGANGGWLKERYGCDVCGVEVDSAMATAAERILGEVRVGDLNRTRLTELFGARRFDLILMGDVLEHLIDPWTTLQDARSLLTTSGNILTSIPNVNHYKVGS